MDPLKIALVVLAIAGIWAVVELALTFRKTRATVNDLTKQVTDITTNANQTIEQVQPIMEKVDGMITDLEPAVKQVQPLLEKANTAVDVVTVDLASVNDILVDVSSVTDTASNVTSAVSKATNSAVSGVAGVVGKFTGGGKSRKNKIAGKTEGEAAVPAIESPVEPQVADDPIVDDEPEAPKTYFTYGSTDESE